MNQRSSDTQSDVTIEPANGTTSMVPGSARRAIAVRAGKTVVVQSRIPTQYKAMIWFSFVLNAVLLLLLLIGGLSTFSFYRSTQAQLQAAGADLALDTPAGQRLSQLSQNPAEAVATARYTADELMTSIEGLQTAHIRSTIPIDEQLPIALDVPVNQNTVVQTTGSVPLVMPASFFLPAGGGQINGTVSLSLPAGMELPVNLNMTIPISSSVPVRLDVPVDIAMQDTELADDFQRLHDLVEPAAELVKAR